MIINADNFNTVLAPDGTVQERPCPNGREIASWIISILHEENRATPGTVAEVATFACKGCVIGYVGEGTEASYVAFCTADPQPTVTTDSAEAIPDGEKVDPDTASDVVPGLLLQQPAPKELIAYTTTNNRAA